MNRDLIKVGNKYQHIKTGKTVEVISAKRYQWVELKHSSGRITRKQEHYFAYEYEPPEEI